jgi:hypothetical protein
MESGCAKGDEKTAMSSGVCTELHFSEQKLTAAYECLLLLKKKLPLSDVAIQRGKFQSAQLLER